MKYNNVLERYLDIAIHKINQSGRVFIRKTPMSFRLIRKPLGRENVYECCKGEQQQPTYMGTLRGGRMIAFDMVSVNGSTAHIKLLTKAQMETLLNFRSLGAQACIFLAFGAGKKFYRIPVDLWVNMECNFDRNFIMPKDIGEFEIKFHNGSYDFFDGLLEE